jgi:hypothetical protein
MDKRIRAYINLLNTSGFPPGFNNWDAVIDPVSKRTLGHLAAKLDKLPPGFDRWYISDLSGWTVAHEYIRQHKKISRHFKNWDLADHNLWTVAHEARMQDCLPKGFNRHDLLGQRR